jgi:prepilin-type processing-associated H-X9-DG protein
MDNDNNNTWIIGLQGITDGTSNTILIGEVGESQDVHKQKTDNGNFPLWSGGNNNAGCNGWQSMGGHLRLGDDTFYLNRKLGPESNLCFGSLHPAGAQFVFADGSVRFIYNTVDTSVYFLLCSRLDGKPAFLP